MSRRPIEDGQGERPRYRRTDRTEDVETQRAENAQRRREREARRRRFEKRFGVRAS